MEELKIDAEFESKCPPLTEEEFEQLSPSAIHDNARVDKTLRGAKRYINQIYLIYNGSRIQNALPMKF